MFFLLNIRLAFRNLLRNRIYSFLIIGGFAIGFAACIMIGLFYRTETTVNHGFANHSRIYRLYDVKKNRCNLNWDLFPIISSDYAAVEVACPLDYQDMEQLTVKDEQSNKAVSVKYLAATTNDFFSVFSVKLVQGVPGTAFTGMESIAVSRSLAASLFGEQDPIGKKINVSNYFYGTVSSVFDEFPANSSFRADVILNSENEKFRFSSTIINGFRYNPTNLFVMIRDGMSPQNLALELNKSAAIKSLDVDSLSLQGLDEIYLSELTIKSRHAKGNPALLKIFLAIATLILFLSSINYLNYSVSMQYTKLREFGIKKTFGGGWGNLAGYAITEVSIGILVSLLMALMLTDLMLSYSEFLFGKSMVVGWRDWLAVAPWFIGALIVVILVNSLIPVYILTKFNIVEFLAGGREKRRGRQIWKHTLLTFQLTVSTTLIAIVFIIFRQLNYVNRSDPGFDRELLLRINIPYRFQHTDALSREIRNLPFVENATVSVGCPGMINLKMGSNTGANSFDINCIKVGANYLETMGIDLIEGRDFLDGDLNRSCMINEKALKQYGWNNFEGNRYNNGQEGGYEVIGVINNFKFESFHQSVEPLALIFTGAGDGNVLSLRMKPGKTGQQIDQIIKIWKSFSPDEPFSFMFYDDFFQAMYAREQKLARSITFFSLIAIVLTCMGILGHIFMMCLTRVKEIGIRKINGARISQVLLILNSNFILWVAVAFVISAPVSFFIMRKWLENFSYKTGLEWWLFVLSGLVALMITMITVSWQSWKAATRNPVEALRYE